MKVQGLAQKNYLKISEPFWHRRALSMAEEWVQEGIVDALDLFFAKKMDRYFNIQTSSFLWIYLLRASKEGHLCVQLSSKYLPYLSFIFKSEQGELEPNSIGQVQDKIEEDFALIQQIQIKDNPWIVLENNCLYLRKNKEAEDLFWSLTNQLQRDKPDKKMDQLILDPNLLEDQKKAIETALQSCLSLITGGPGVGKTFTAAKLVQTFLKQYPDARIALVAPTGKAAANLQEAFSGFEALNLEVLTLHKLLYQKIYSFLPFDLLLVDESSMVDLFRMKRLFEVLKPGSRCVLLGDPCQLPPIEMGFIFLDLVQSFPHVSYLKTCLRAEKQELIDAACAVNQGQAEHFISLIETKKKLTSLEGIHPEEIYLKLKRKIEAIWRSDSPEQLLKALSRFMILSPLKRGVYGFEAVNQFLKKAFQKAKAQPIMITSNDSNLELYNGDMGIIFENDQAYFPVRHSHQSYQDARTSLRKIPKAHLPPYDVAYCISVHKSQGSEYEDIVILLPPASEVFGRKLLYTALTRTKKTFEIFGNLPTLQKMIAFNSKRMSKVQINQDHDE